MTSRKQFEMKTNTWVGLVALVLIFVAVFFIARGIFNLLAWLSPVLLIATAILDYKVIVNYVKWLVDLVKKNTPLGIGAILLSLIGYPVLFGFLFGRAFLNYRVRQARKSVENEREGEYVDFEELETKKLELPPLEPKKPKPEPEPQPQKRSDYEDLFNE
ncbi:MAG: hypothetical protein KDC44_06220 [Phaeodactylibacter sp.]|nr:hypothetical protein [Phaeodactylibacter sp.]